MKKYLILLSLIIVSILPFGTLAQVSSQDIFSSEDDDLQIGGDIFSDFNEDMEASKVLEDERFYRFGRFYSMSFSLGVTTFDGNRGAAYDNAPPSWGFGLNFFNDFKSAFGMGVELSKHTMLLEVPTRAYDPDAVGLIEVTMMRTYFSYRYYIDTANLGTAITYSNPYFTTRFEYWYLTNDFIDQSLKDKETEGGFGIGIGGGLEFPIKIRESYIGVEALYHSISFGDKFTSDFQDVDGGSGGYDDLTGNVWTLFVSYVISW
jgi:hypothetical protein